MHLTEEKLLPFTLKQKPNTRRFPAPLLQGNGISASMDVGLAYLIAPEHSSVYSLIIL